MKIDAWITKYSQEPDNIILAGDFNCNLEKTDDHSANALQKLIKNNYLTDLWLDIRPQDPGYTWCNGANLPTSRIDYVLVSKSFVYQAQNILLREIPGSHSGGTRMSDHKCIKVIFDINLNLRGPGYWKFNTSLLEDTIFVTQMKRIIKEFDSNENSQLLWESLKIKMKNYSQQYSKIVSKSCKRQINYLENEISIIEKSDNDMNKKRKLESELKELIDKKAKGAQIRSRANWIDRGETNSSFFLKLESSHQKK